MAKRLAFLVFAAVAALSGPARSAEEASPVARWEADHSVILNGAEVTLSDFHWIARPLVVFADSPADPRFQQQMDLLTARLNELAERDVVVIVDTDPDAKSEPRITLRPRGFMLALMAKDGNVLFRKPLPWDVREIGRSIDKLPLRQQEIRDRRALTQ
ncbi:DUF4174 domain-containing protein [Rhodovulum marinum]|uniref:Uncharacterized protein DUF4174 n=1 Tax=Rhodovulum marinum TaxID=320662 RepID=A0A4R2Q5X8_9RHOB|nr:DUF4174 domain-containing protein [Rhodovulum marinum]TCP44047.1 uncharacterized protein DUF4174 [Rhodovulum marinum]